MGKGTHNGGWTRCRGRVHGGAQRAKRAKNEANVTTTQSTLKTWEEGAIPLERATTTQ